jgi:hypothetical protein
MATFQQTEINAIEYAGVTSNANFDRRRVAMSGSSFAGPEGAGSSFSMKAEEISSSSSDFMSDD